MRAIRSEFPDVEAKVDTARTLWVPAVNALGGFGRWSFYEVTDPWNAEHDLRVHILSLANGARLTLPSRDGSMRV